MGTALSKLLVLIFEHVPGPARAAVANAAKEAGLLPPAFRLLATIRAPGFVGNMRAPGIMMLSTVRSPVVHSACY